MIPTPTEIANFLELYNTRHLSNAAIRLGIAQPSLTQSLKKLEEKLGAPLFIRSKRGLVPTEAAGIFYTRARSLAEGWESVRDDVAKMRNELTGRFRLGCHPSVGAYALPPFLKRMNEEAPLIELQLTHDFSRKVAEGVVSFELDFAFVVNPVRHPDLVLVKIGDDRVTFWGWGGKTPPPKRLLADTSLVQINSLLQKIGNKEFKDWPIVHSTSLELIRTLVQAGQGVGILPERVAQASGPKLTLWKESLPHFHDEIYLVYRRELLMSRAGKELARIAKAKL